MSASTEVGGPTTINMGNPVITSVTLPWQRDAFSSRNGTTFIKTMCPKQIKVAGGLVAPFMVV